MNPVAKHIAKLSPQEQRALLAQLLQKRANQPKYFPLSFAQERIWFLAQLEPDNPFYNLPGAVQLSGSLNLAVLEQSLKEIIRRHGALRTTFPVVEGQPMQAIAPTGDLTLTIVNLRELPKSQWDSQIQQLASEEAKRPFDLNCLPLQRFTILQFSDRDFVLLFTRHHIISDKWSMNVFVRELTALYQAFCGGKPSSLTELPIQYADFAVWQRQWLQGEVLASQLSYWKRQLEGAPAVLALPTDRTRPAIQSFRGAMQPLTLPQSLTEALKHLGQQEEVTLFMVLLAAFKALLYYYADQEDILVGSPVANRNRVELEGLIGFFVNTLVMRTDLSGSPSFRTLLSRVREVVLEAYAHQDLPFERLVKELQPERNLSYNPLFQVWFVFHHDAGLTWELPDLSLTSLEVDVGVARHDLMLSLSETPEGLKGAFYYQTDLFETSTIARMAEQFSILLDAVVKQPEIQLQELKTVLDEAQKQSQRAAAEEFQQLRLQKLKKALGTRQ